MIRIVLKKEKIDKKLGIAVLLVCVGLSGSNEQTANNSRKYNILFSI